MFNHANDSVAGGSNQEPTSETDQLPEPFTLAMTKPVKDTFSVSLKINTGSQPESLVLQCKLSPSGINEQFGVPLFQAHMEYDELAHEKTRFRLDYIQQRLDDTLRDAVLMLWRESGRETERQRWALKEREKLREFLDSEHVEAVALKEWRRHDRTEVLTGEGYEPRSHGGARRTKKKKGKTPE
jgi:hypothetical protein